MITVVSACYGAYDQPIAPPEQDIDVRWVMVTDGAVPVPEPWEAIYEPRPHLHPRMAAKVPKCLPFEYAETDVAIWLDASAQILTTSFVRTVAETLADGDIAQWVHPQRDCIHPEADVSASMAKYEGQPVHEQVAHYRKIGHPDQFGLWATGCMAWRITWTASDAGREWLAEQVQWTYQDQLSWPAVVRWNDLDIRPLPGGLWDRQMVQFRGHASHQ